MSPENDQLTRRSFMAKAGAGWTVFSLASVASLLATARFMFPNDLFEPPTKFKIGMPDDFAATPNGAVDERFKAKNGIWVVRNYGQKLYLKLMVELTKSIMPLYTV